MNSYFPHDSNARNSEKLLKVRMKYGAAGYGVYFMILERLRDEADYMSIKDYNVIAFDLRVDASMIKAVVEDFGLFVFTDDGKYFYSEGFKKRMAIKDQKSKKRAEAGKKGANVRWQTHSNAIAKPMANDSKESKVNKSKVNKTKIKTNKPASQNKQLAEDFNKLWKLYPSKKGKKPAFSAYKRAIKSGITNRQIQNGIIELVKHGDPKYYPNGSTWFSQERWSDTYDESPSEPLVSKKPVYSDGEQRSIDIMQAFSTHDHDVEKTTQALQAKYPEIVQEEVERQVYPEKFRKEDVF